VANRPTVARKSGPASNPPRWPARV